MPLGEKINIKSNDPKLVLSVYKGHYATAHSHINYYIDIAQNKSSLVQAQLVAKKLAANYKSSTLVDTILCLDGTEVIATCLAKELTSLEWASVNSGRDICILTPEHNAGSQLFFRDNTAPMIAGKCVLVLAASVVTGFTARSAIESVNYYGGKVTGITSIFATIESVCGIKVTSVFANDDLPGYEHMPANECPMCKKGEKINALVNSFGCSML